MKQIVEEFFTIGYYEKAENHLIKQLDKVSIVSVHCNTNEKGEFFYGHFSTKFSSDKKCTEYLYDLELSTEEKYESILATFFQKVDENRKIFNSYRQAIWDRNNL